MVIELNGRAGLRVPDIAVLSGSKTEIMDRALATILPMNSEFKLLKAGNLR